MAALIRNVLLVMCYNIKGFMVCFARLAAFRCVFCRFGRGGFAWPRFDCRSTASFIDSYDRVAAVQTARGVVNSGVLGPLLTSWYCTVVPAVNVPWYIGTKRSGFKDVWRIVVRGPYVDLRMQRGHKSRDADQDRLNVHCAKSSTELSRGRVLTDFRWRRDCIERKN